MSINVSVGVHLPDDNIKLKWVVGGDVEWLDVSTRGGSFAFFGSRSDVEAFLEAALDVVRETEPAVAA